MNAEDPQQQDTTTNPYSAPQTVSPAMPVTSADVPDDILKKIKGGWVCAIISGSLTLAIVVFAILSGGNVMGLDAWSFIDVVLIFGMALGIYKKSRTCAVIMLVYFVGSKIMQMMDSGQASGWVLALVFIYFYARAVQGTFQYHSWKKAQGV